MASPPHPAYDGLEPCDIIMKGGITSGVVYPDAVRVLSETYRFMGIGGTSAGAIAAAAAAAAEYGRRPGSAGTSFAGLTELPAWLGARNSTGRSNLASLFEPQPATRKAFDSLFAAVADPKATSAAKRLWNVVKTALSGYRRASLLGALPGGVIVVLAATALGFAFHLSTALTLIPVLLVALVIAACGAVLGSLAALVTDAFGCLPKNFFGLCTGGGGTAATGTASALKRDPPGPLTFWLTDFLDELAGVQGRAKPLTFGDLWDGNVEPALGTHSSAHAVRLNMVTTDLTEGQPRRLPFPPRKLNLGGRQIDERLYVREADLSAFFPPRVVEHFKAVGATRQMWTDPRTQEQLLALPPASDLPVIFATRLSLSFPGLLSAFPIYVDKENDFAERHWFSDGGITSNFPAQFYDSPLPNWPTFGINLHAIDPRAVETGNECDNVTMWPSTEIWQPEITSVGGFLGAIKDTAQNWRDNSQIAIPGFRERIAHIGFHRGEGGLNLYMPSALITRLGQRGGCAGETLATVFHPRGDGTTTNWIRYRWTRYRSTFAVLEKWFAMLHAADVYPWSANDPHYRQLHQRPDLPDPFEPKQAQFADAKTNALLDLADGWGPDLPDSFQGAQGPDPELRIVPRL